MFILNAYFSTVGLPVHCKFIHIQFLRCVTALTKQYDYNMIQS